MKIVINGEYGGFEINERVNDLLGLDEWDEATRTNPQLIDAIETLGSKEVSGKYADLRIAEIPDNSTDWIIEEYDGLEKVIYVVDGNIHWTYGK